MTNTTSIVVRYRNVDGWHIFTCDDLPGLYVASQDAELAYNDVAPSIQMLLKLNEGLNCQLRPEISFSDFLETVRKRKRSKPAKRAEIIHRPVSLSSQRYAVSACV